MTAENKIRVGVDVGGTKIEALALDIDGRELGRHRIATPVGDYRGTVAAVEQLVRRLEAETGREALVGMGIPGTVTAQGVVKNANSVCLNGMPFQRDVSERLGREVRCANDANCLAVSEATDGAGAGFGVVFAVILGTGCGGGIALNGRVHAGLNGVAGEWGHNPLPWQTAEEYPGPECFCGKRGCIEQWISGTGFAEDYERGKGMNGGGIKHSAAEIAALAEAGDAMALAATMRLYDRMARSLAMVVNLLDPDVIVIGGGLSRFARIYESVPPMIRQHVMGKECETPLRMAMHGDSSGVRGAAWLWGVESALRR